MNPLRGFDVTLAPLRDPQAILWALVFVAALVAGGFLLHRMFLWWHAWREHRAFFARVVQRGVTPDNEDILVDLVNHNLDILGRPTEIFRSLRVFDLAAGAEIKRLLSSEHSERAKEDAMDRIYALRRQMYPARGIHLQESGGGA